jgi:hypothetical protein
MRSNVLSLPRQLVFPTWDRWASMKLVEMRLLDYRQDLRGKT